MSELEVIDADMLQQSGSWLFEGIDHGGVGLSFFQIDSLPGRAQTFMLTHTRRSTSISEPDQLITKQPRRLILRQTRRQPPRWRTPADSDDRWRVLRQLVVRNSRQPSW